MISAALMPENLVADRGIVIRQIPEAGAENCRNKRKNAKSQPRIARIQFLAIRAIRAIRG